MTGGKEKHFGAQVAVLKPRPLRPQSKNTRATCSIHNSLSKELPGREDCCISHEDYSCFPWVHHNDFYAVSFSPPGRVANPIVRDNRFLIDSTDHLDTFGSVRSDRQDMFIYNTETCSAGDMETDYMIMFA